MDVRITLYGQPILKLLTTEEIIRSLKKRSLNLESRDYRNRTLLHHAIKLARIDVVRLFLENGAKVNVADNDSETPLLAAARSIKATQLVPLLMEYKANLFAKDWSGENALHSLSRNLSEDDLTDLARFFIKKGVPIDQKNRIDHQPLHLAVYRRKNDLVNLFLDNGADVNARADGGDFPLYIAAEDDNPVVLETLLKRGANIDMMTDRGRTALHAACTYASMVNCGTKSIEILLSVGANMFVKDIEGKIPLHPIIGNMRVVKMLAVKKASMELPMKRHFEKIIENKYLSNRLFYQVCTDEIETTKSTRFIETCSFFDILTKCPCQIAKLMRNLEFEKKFKDFKLGTFPTYAEDILAAFERAQLYYQSMLDQENLILEALDETLPYVVACTYARGTTRQILGCGICEMKRTMQASRQQFVAQT